MLPHTHVSSSDGERRPVTVFLVLILVKEIVYENTDPERLAGTDKAPLFAFGLSESNVLSSSYD